MIRRKPTNPGGRPSLSKRGGPTAIFPVRISPDLKRRVVARAEALGITYSELSRRALEAFLSSS